MVSLSTGTQYINLGCKSPRRCPPKPALLPTTTPSQTYSVGPFQLTIPGGVPWFPWSRYGHPPDTLQLTPCMFELSIPYTLDLTSILAPISSLCTFTSRRVHSCRPPHLPQLGSSGPPVPCYCLVDMWIMLEDMGHGGIRAARV